MCPCPQGFGISGEEAIASDEFFDELIGTSLYSKPLLPRATLPPINTTSKFMATDPTAYQQKRTPVKKKQVSPMTSVQEK